jgi:hypothetical protein
VRQPHTLFIVHCMHSCAERQHARARTTRRACVYSAANCRKCA